MMWWTIRSTPSWCRSGERRVRDAGGRPRRPAAAAATCCRLPPCPARPPHPPAAVPSSLPGGGFVIDEDGLGYTDVGEEVDWGAAEEEAAAEGGDAKGGKGKKGARCLAAQRGLPPDRLTRCTALLPLRPRQQPRGLTAGHAPPAILPLPAGAAAGAKRKAAADPVPGARARMQKMFQSAQAKAKPARAAPVDDATADALLDDILGNLDTGAAPMPRWRRPPARPLSPAASQSLPLPWLPRAMCSPLPRQGGASAPRFAAGRVARCMRPPLHTCADLAAAPARPCYLPAGPSLRPCARRCPGVPPRRAPRPARPRPSPLLRSRQPSPLRTG